MANAHSAELAYLHDFTMAGRPLTADQVALADDMKRRWAAFARGGSPRLPGETRWPPTHAGRHTVLTLTPGHVRTSTAFATDHQCGFWAGLGSPGDSRGPAG
jgi:para-nitrobenzyl esterase